MDIITILYLTLVGLCFIFTVKALVTYKQQCTIADAVFRYTMDLIDQSICEYDVDILDIEDFDKTLWRLWDWGYKRILPKDKFEIIKPYI